MFMARVSQRSRKEQPGLIPFKALLNLAVGIDLGSSIVTMDDPLFYSLDYRRFWGKVRVDNKEFELTIKMDADKSEENHSDNIEADLRDTRKFLDDSQERLQKKKVRFEDLNLKLKLTLIAFNGGLIAIVVSSFAEIQYNRLGVFLLIVAIFAEIMSFVYKHIQNMHRYTYSDLAFDKIDIVLDSFKTKKSEEEKENLN